MTMAEFADILHRDHTIRTSDDMHVPRMKGSHSFTTGHAITLSALCNSMEKPSQADSSQEVNYEDVFGGPPRFAALMSVPHSGSAILDRATGRAPSFRSSSLPVFELPVFGDNANVFGSIVYHARANSDVYDDIFDEEGPMPDDAFLAPNLYGVSRSKPSSRFSSRRMSPVHPAVASAGQLGGDEFLVLTNSASFSKTRPAAEKVSRHGSLHSASSFDESGADGPLSGLRNESFTSSLPSSPPQSCHLQSFIGSTGTVDIGTSTTSVEFDDVFGGFPKRMYSQPFSAVPCNSKNVTDASESHSARIPMGCESPGVKGLAVESRVGRSSSAAYALDTSDTTLSRSSSINDDREQHENEIRIYRQADLSASEWSEQIVGEASGAANDASLSFQSSSSLHQPRPSSAPPVTQLKYKSWKDWVSELPHSHTSTLSSINGVDSVVTAASMVTPTKEVAMDKDAVESCIEKQFVKNLQQAEHYNEKPSHTIAAGHKVKVKPAEYTVEMEEKELQALLTNAWKINEQIERESYNARFPEEVLKVSDLELHQNDKKSSQSLRNQQRDHMCLDERNDDINWKEWRKYGRGQRKHGGLATKNSSLKTPVSADAEDMHMNRVLASSEVSPDGSTALYSIKKSSEGMCGVCENDDEYHYKEQRQGRSDDVDQVASSRGSISGLSWEFLYSDEHNRISSSVQVEDADCLIDLASSLDGFQEINGESFERRKSRWERHVRARDRAAKALEELQHRDAELQREQQEKKQFSETSDGKIKRWAGGKEGNLRALLSNLQHVLWLECGWQPIPLTDLIEVPDVKRAYRKATLFVHPDKVQQKGATIQQKYIAERVFDILQEAWKTFSMQENF